MASEKVKFSLKSIHNELQSLESRREHLIKESRDIVILYCIGEIKRMIYDMVRYGKYDKAESLFIVMQELYSDVYPFAIYDNIVNGIRKKLDVSKILIENTRELITEESRRSMLIGSLKKLNDTL